jgi:hypothetical protein
MTEKDSEDIDYKGIVDAIKHNSIVFFLGAGANLPVEEAPHWDSSHPTRPPSGDELAKYMALDFIDRVPALAKKDLQHVATFYEIKRKSRALYSLLHDIFDVDYPPRKIHTFLAELPSLLRSQGCTAEYPLIVTTNYDDILERALGDQPHAVYTYIEHGGDRGKFRLCNDGNVIEKPNELRLGKLGLKERFVIFKMHGTITRSAESSDLEKDEYVITEDHYIDYLAGAPIADVVPTGLVTALKGRAILFLGYALQDWHLRVLLRRVLQGQPLSTSMWSVQLKADEVYRAYSQHQNITLIEQPLDEFVDRLQNELTGGTAAQRGTSA